jgi:hypothetical protein
MNMVPCLALKPHPRYDAKWTNANLGKTIALDRKLRQFAKVANQCYGSGSGSVGSVFFGTSWIRILLSLSKNCKKNLYSYCFVTSL